MISKIHKILLALCAVLAVAKGYAEEVATHSQLVHIAPEVRAEDYITLIQLQHEKSLQDYDKIIEHFKQRYLGRIDGIHIQLDMVIANIVQIEEHLNPLEVLSDLNKECVSKHRVSIPTVVKTKTSITSCSIAASSELSNLLANSVNTRNNLEHYYIEHYNKHIKECKKHIYSNANYTSCIIGVTSNANAYTIANKKTFETKMDAAECTAKAYIKKALDCSYTVQNNAITLMAQANLLINNCINHKDECPPCDNTHSCSNVIQISEEDVKRKLVPNPFFGLDKHEKCAIISVSKHE